MSKISDSELADRLERHLIIEALEVDLVRLTMGNMISPRRLMREVDQLLNIWGRIYKYEDAREIKSMTKVKSLLGKLFKDNNRDNNVHSQVVVFKPNTERYERINTAVNKMPQFYKEIVRRHYIIQPEDELHRNELATKQYALKMEIPLSTYTDHLREAKQLFIAMGGI